MVDSDRLPHAILLLGPPGSAKLALALALAVYLLCERRPGEDACGECRACRKSARCIHPDLHFSFPTVGANVVSDAFLPQWRAALAENPYLDLNDWLRRIGAENRQGNINKEECLGIIRKLSLKTFESDHKVLLMWMPELLGKEGNRLLKIIEEPPPGTLFLLVAEDTEPILSTILSRCRLIKVPPFNDEELREGLARRFSDLDEARARQIAFIADGDFNEALLLALRAENENAGQLLDWLRKCYRGNGVDLVKWVDDIAGIGREAQKNFLHYGLHFLRELLTLRLRGEGEARLRPAEMKSAQDLANMLNLEQMEALARLFNDCAYHVERNANPKILFLDASLNIHYIFKNHIPASTAMPG
jgi:DNA polymerase-3 subunit delta'